MATNQKESSKDPSPEPPTRTGAVEMLQLQTPAKATSITDVSQGLLQEVRAAGQDVRQDVHQALVHHLHHLTATTNTNNASLQSNTTTDKNNQPPKQSKQSLLQEVSELLSGSIMIYGAVDLRKLAAQGKLKMEHDPSLIDKIVELPIKRSEAMKLLSANLETLKSAKFNSDLYLSVVEKVGAMWENENDENKTSVVPTSRSDFQVVVFDDENSAKELVYLIAIEPDKRVIVVVFRGSVTVNDWARDADSRMTMVPNPVTSNNIPQSARVGIHGEFS
jgi:hypothetical protein